MRPILLAVAAFAAGLALAAPAEAAHVQAADLLGAEVRAADVSGDDEQDRYVGTGGLLLPAGVPTGTRREVASCPGCSWRLTSPCVQAPGVGFDGQPACVGVVRGCPGGHLMRGWFRPVDGAWRELGLVCLGPRGPVTVADVARAIAEEVPHRLPPLQPAGDPARGVLAQLPVVFRSGQGAGPLAWTDDILGSRVAVTARSAWTWSFGDGATLVTTDPGDRYPRGRVTHAYRGPGVMTVTCTARWQAEFTVDGLGPFPVTEPVQQDARLEVVVGEGRAVLTPGGVTQ